jgi:hypothetical protein
LVAAGLDAVQEVQKVGLEVFRILRRRHTVDAGSAILAGEPEGFLHPFQVDDVVQRGQSHPSFRSCQFSYPLPFRAQVCETQSSLPCFPSAVLSSRRPPSLDRVPVSPVPRRRQYYEGATTSHPRIPGRLFVSLPGPTRFLLASCSLLPALPGRRRPPPRARIIVRPAILFAGAHSRGRERDLSGSQAPHPVPLPRSKTPAEPTVLANNGTVDAAPASVTTKASALLISGLPRGFSTCCLRFKNGVATATCKTRFRLAGWPLPGGS